MNQNSKEKWVFRLFAAGKTIKVDHSVTVLEQICKEYLDGLFDIEVIDVIENPHIAVDENIIATPTLQKKHPLPVRRIIGDITNKEKVIEHLGITGKKMNQLTDEKDCFRK